MTFSRCLDTLHQTEGRNMLWMRRRLHFYSGYCTSFFAGGGLFSIADNVMKVTWLKEELNELRETHTKLLASSGHIGRRLESYVRRRTVIR